MATPRVCAALARAAGAGTILLAALLAAATWGSPAATPARAQPRSVGQSTDGRVLYQANCAYCHGQAAEGTDRAPGLLSAGMASVDFMLSTGRMPLREADEPLRRRPPAFDPPQIAALNAYLSTLVDGPAIPDVSVEAGDLAEGGEIYRLECAACHGWSAEGGALIGGAHAPPLQHSTPTQVGEAIRTGPGTMPQYPPAVFTDAQVDALAAYVAYLQQPADPGGWPAAHLGPFAEGAVALLVGLPLLGLAARWIGKRV